jgi:hypothetical protein
MSGSGAAGCPTCGAAVHARFCAACGEEQITERDYSVAHYVGHVFESLTNFDFRSLRAVWTLMARPGVLTRDYLNGRRRIYLGPVQLFVIVNVVFAMAGPSTFRTPLVVQEHDRPLPAFKRSVVASALTARGVPRDEFRRSFDDAAELQAKTWVFAMIPLIALTTAALYGFRRFFFEHLIFATHFLAFMLAWMLASGLLVRWSVRLTDTSMTAAGWDSVMSLLTLAGLAAYLLPALRRVFGQGWAAAVARTLAVAVLIYPIVLTYRFLLFFITLLTMH